MLLHACFYGTQGHPYDCFPMGSYIYINYIYIYIYILYTVFLHYRCVVYVHVHVGKEVASFQGQ